MLSNRILMSKVLKFLTQNKINRTNNCLVIHPHIKKKKKNIDRFKTVIRFNDYSKKYIDYGKKLIFVCSNSITKNIPTKKISTVLVDNSLKINQKMLKIWVFYI